MASNDRKVVPNSEQGGWDVVKEGHRRATAHAETEQKAVARARELTRREGGGEVRVMNRTGKIVASKTIARSTSASTARRAK